MCLLGVYSFTICVLANELHCENEFLFIFAGAPQY